MRVWWLVFWRGMLGAVFFGALVGILSRIVFDALGLMPPFVSYVAWVFGYVAGVIWGVFVTRMVLRKKYIEFRIALLPHSSS